MNRSGNTESEFYPFGVWVMTLVGMFIGMLVGVTIVESDYAWPNCAILMGPAELRPRISLPEDGDTGVPMRYCLCEDSRSEEDP